MTFDEWARSRGYTQRENGDWVVAGDDSGGPLDPGQLEQDYARSFLFGQAGGPVDPGVRDGVQYAQIGGWANNDPNDQQRSLQLEIDHLKQFGIEPVYDDQYGWIVPDDAKLAQAHPALDNSSIFDYGPFILGGGLAALAAGAGVAGAGALASEGAPAADLFAELAFDPMLTQVGGSGIGTETISPLLQTVAKQAAGGAIQAGLKGGDPLEGALMGGAIGGLSSGIGMLTPGLTPAPILDQMAGSAAMGGIVSGAMGGDPLQGALSGATSAGIGNVAGSLTNGVTDIPVIDKALGQAGASAALSGIRGGDPIQAALSSALNSGMKTVTGEVWNAAKNVWENPYTGTQDEPQALIQTPDSYWSMTAGGTPDVLSEIVQNLGGSLTISLPESPLGPDRKFTTLDEAQEQLNLFKDFSVDSNGNIWATDTYGELVTSSGQPEAASFDRGRIIVGSIVGGGDSGSQDFENARQQVEAAEQAQQEQERQYAAEQSRIAQEQAVAEAAQIAGEQVAVQAQAEGARIAQEQEAARRAEAQRVAQRATQPAPVGTGDIVSVAPPFQTPFTGTEPTTTIPVELPATSTGGSNGIEGALPAILLPGVLAGIEGGQGTAGGLPLGNSGGTNMAWIDDLINSFGGGDPGQSGIGIDMTGFRSPDPFAADVTPFIDEWMGQNPADPMSSNYVDPLEGTSASINGLPSINPFTGLPVGQYVNLANSGSGQTVPYLPGAGGSATGGAGGSSNINIYNQNVDRPASDMWSLANLAKILGIGAVGAGVVGAAGSGLGGGSQTTATSTTPAPSPEELELIKLNAELARRQLASIDQLQPLQKQLLEASQYDLAQQQAVSKARHAAITPEQEAALAQVEFERSKRLGPIQDQLLQQQMDIINTRGAATPEQLARTRAAADAAIAAGTGDINTQIKRGIGLISDEVANARGLRLTDTPIMREASLLTDRGNEQIASLVRNLRASEAQANLTYPLAANQQQSSMIQGQQTLNDAAKNFQDQLRQQANANRMAIIGQSSGTGIGLANTGNSSTALNALTSARLASGTRTEDTTKGIGLTGIGQLASGVGNLISAVG